MAKQKAEAGNGIPDLYIRFHHADIANISDRTFRQLLREFSIVTNDILSEEIEFLLLNIDLPYRQKQSIRDKLYSRFSETTNFYIDKIEKGSLILLALISASTIFTLGKIVHTGSGEFSKKGENKISEADAEIVNSYLIKHLENRNQILIENVLPKFENVPLGNRFFIRKFIAEEKDKETVITAQIESTEEGKAAEKIVENNSYAHSHLVKLATKSKK